MNAEKKRGARCAWAWAGLLCMAMLMVVSPAPAIAEEKPLAEYFYENYCGSCDPVGEFGEAFRALTGESLNSYRFAHHNTGTETGKAALVEAVDHYGISAQDIRLPMVVVHGEVFMGQEQIDLHLPQYSLAQVESTVSVLYYLYVTACGECAQAKRVLDALPRQVSIAMGEYSFDSDLIIHTVDIGQETGLAYALFDAYGVPDEHRLAPLVLMGTTYYQGAETIERSLEAALRRGDGIRTLVVDGENEMPALQWGPTVLAGLIGGLNPCALSMLLLFLSLLVNIQKRTGTLALVFLSSKFVTYLLIGTLFLAAFQAWNPTWLPLATKLLLTGLSIVLIVLNLRDAWMAHQERYGAIRNQLPPKLRGRLQSRIRGAFEGGGPSLLLIAGLGVMVAAGEFLCSGQVYLATLLTALQKATDTARLFGLLVLYCLAFLLPSALLCVLVVRGRSAFALSEFLRRHMAAVKVITALFFAAVLLVLWVL